MPNLPSVAIQLARVEIARPAQGVALAAARRQDQDDLAGWCLLAVRTWLGVPARARSAIRAWDAVPAGHRHPKGTPPPGAPVFWDVGAHGHIALSVGGGRVISTDIKRRGKADVVAIDRITDRWGARYLGWSESLNGIRVVAAPRKRTRAKASEYVEVRRGDTLAALAGADWRSTWLDDRNADLRATRVRPELIRPGDRLWVGPG